MNVFISFWYVKKLHKNRIECTVDKHTSNTYSQKYKVKHTDMNIS